MINDFLVGKITQLHPLHPRHPIDASLADAAYALVASTRRGPADSDLAEALVCLSVRSAFDLLLGCLELSPGDEVLVSAVTHPDMVRVIELHGLRPVPVDIEAHTLGPAPEALMSAINERSRAVLVAHLFGVRLEFDHIVQVARSHGLLLIEDCAQSAEYPFDQGDRRADVSLFSYGFIKTATALGGRLRGYATPS